MFTTRFLRRALVPVLLVGTGLFLAVSPILRAAAETRRTVYFIAIDERGAFVNDLQPADLVVKEGGKQFEVVSVAPATEPFHLALLVDDSGEGTLQAAVAHLAAASTGKGLVSISRLVPQPNRLTDFTNDPVRLKEAIGKIVQRGAVHPDLMQLADAVSWAARDLQKRKLSRPVIVAMTTGGEDGTLEIAQSILNDLRSSGASLHLVHVVGSPLGRVLMEGPQVSGGSTQVASSTQAFSDALGGIVNALSHQIVATYVLPNGTKPNARLQLTSTRANVRIIAPSQIPDK